MTDKKPFSEACEQNKRPILRVLERELARSRAVLEIGSGTGQHAVFFARGLPHLCWYASELPGGQGGMRLWLEEAGLDNIRGPCTLDVNQRDWPLLEVDAVFSANTAHIMDWSSVVNMLAGVGRLLPLGGVFCLYGPFNYDGAYTSESNARFDAWLQSRDPASGIRDVAALEAVARDNGLHLRYDHEMPVNNRTLVWERRA